MYLTARTWVGKKKIRIESHFDKKCFNNEDFSKIKLKLARLWRGEKLFPKNGKPTEWKNNNEKEEEEEEAWATRARFFSWSSSGTHNGIPLLNKSRAPPAKETPPQNGGMRNSRTRRSTRAAGAKQQPEASFTTFVRGTTTSRDYRRRWLENASWTLLSAPTSSSSSSTRQHRASLASQSCTSYRNDRILALFPRFFVSVCECARCLYYTVLGARTLFLSPLS